jgi:hypothetical protein
VRDRPVGKLLISTVFKHWSTKHGPIRTKILIRNNLVNKRRRDKLRNQSCNKFKKSMNLSIKTLIEKANLRNLMIQTLSHPWRDLISMWILWPSP